VLSTAKAAAPNNICRLLIDGIGLGTCNILPLVARRAIRWTPPRVCGLAWLSWRIVDNRFQVAP
jgi:hypothetical protein